MDFNGSAAGHPTAGVSSSNKSKTASTNRHHAKIDEESAYELENAVSSLFDIFGVRETNSFSRQSVSDRLIKSIGHKSRKPFSIFYDRLSNKSEFVKIYQELKCQNVNQVDPFVRLLVRIREDSDMLARINSMPSEFTNLSSNSSASYYDQLGGDSPNNGRQTQSRKQPIVTPLVDSYNALSKPSLNSPQLNSSHRVVKQPLITNLQSSSITPKGSPSSNTHQSSRTTRSTSISRLAALASGNSPTSNANQVNQNNASFQVPMNANNFSMSLRNESSTLVDSGGEESTDGAPEYQEQFNTRNNRNHVQNSPNSTAAAGNRSVPSYMSYNFRQCDWPRDNDCYGSLGHDESLSVQRQEQLLLRDLLYVLIGIEGKFIRLKKNRDADYLTLKVDPTADKFHVITVNRILKISFSYSRIIHFVESKGYGLVHQALVAAIKVHLLEYYTLVANMEQMLLNNDLFLQKMFYLLLPFISTFSLLEEIANKLKHKSFGGGVLTILHEKTKSIQGMDNSALDLCLKLTKAASVPYFEILKQWIYYGEIDDARKEFFIEDNIEDSFNSNSSGKDHMICNYIKNQDIGANDYDSEDEYSTDFGKFNDKYWDKRYRVNGSKTPIFLKEKQNIIFKTGKYVSIINKIKQLYVKTQKAAPPLQVLQQQQINDVQSVRGGIVEMAPSISGLTSLIHGYPPPSSSSNFNNIYQMPSQPFSSPFSFADPNQMGMMMPSMTPGFGAIPGTMMNIGCNSSSSSNSQISSSLFGGAVVFTPKPEDISYSFDESTYIAPIMAAYEEASSQLLHILINESQLMETLNAVKHYMFLSMGDFIVYFFKNASKELCKRTDSVVQHRLDSMMGYASGISVCATDCLYLRDSIHVEFDGRTFLKQILKIMRPNDLHSGFTSTSPTSSYFMRSEVDDEDDEDDDVGLNRSVIGSVIEGVNDAIDSHPGASGVTGGKMSISSQVRLRKQLYVNSGRTPKKPLETDKVDAGLDNSVSGNDADAEKQKLFCYESLVLKFDVPFPLSLIFSEKTLFSYQLLFRYVFMCRYAGMELEEAWKDNILNAKLKQSRQLARKAILASSTNLANSEAENNETVKLLVKEFQCIHRKAFVLRHKMIAFVRNFHYFFAFEVIDPSFSQFTSQITKSGSSLDSVIEFHEKFLENCFNKTFLTNIEITSLIIKIFTLCIELSHALKDSMDKEEHDSVMESSCFFGKGNNPYAISRPPSPGADSDDNDGPQKSSKNNFTSLLTEKLNKIYFSDRNFGKSVKTVREIVEKADSHFDRLVMKLLKRIFSDNCEYHMMYPFVSRLDFNDFFRKKLLE